MSFFPKHPPSEVYAVVFFLMYVYIYTLLLHREASMPHTRVITPEITRVDLHLNGVGPSAVYFFNLSLSLARSLSLS